MESWHNKLQEYHTEGKYFNCAYRSSDMSFLSNVF